MTLPPLSENPAVLNPRSVLTVRQRSVLVHADMFEMRKRGSAFVGAGETISHKIFVRLKDHGLVKEGVNAYGRKVLKLTEAGAMAVVRMTKKETKQ